jgi:hypothetical protein
MSSGRNRRPSPALVVGGVALIAALTGTAVGLPGKNSVDKGDLKKNSVTKSEIRKDAVRSAEVDNGSINARDLADAEAFRRVGAPGQPPFSTGGQGDCEWELTTGEVSPVNPAAFYKDAYGVVHMVGAVTADSDTGGDTFCNSGDPGEVEDALVFTLPAGYRPENVTIVGVGNSEAIVVGDESVSLGGEVVPAGSVLAIDGEQIIIDGATFRGAGPGTESIDLVSLSRAPIDALVRRASR